MDVIINPIPNSENNFPQPDKGPVVQWHYEGTERKYGVQVIWQSAGLETTMDYDISMSCIGIKNEDAIWQIAKNNFYTDNKKPEDAIELLALACAQPCYPFRFTATKEGRIISLLNTEKIKSRFADAKPVLMRDFNGDVALAYISAMEVAINKPEKIKNVITADVWLSMFFASVAGSYNSTKTKKITMDIPFFGFEDALAFTGTASIGNPDLTNRAQALLIEAEFEASSTIKNQMALNGKLKATYDIDIPGHQIRNISAHISVNNNGGENHIWLKGYCISAEKIKSEQQFEKDKSDSKGWFSLFSD